MLELCPRSFCSSLMKIMPTKYFETETLFFDKDRQYDKIDHPQRREDKIGIASRSMLGSVKQKE